MANDSLYDSVLSITEDYLGPAAPRFINRLVTNHLGKPASKINKTDIPALVVWIQLAATVITDDEQMVADYIQRLEKLSGKSAQLKGRNRLSSHIKSTA